MSLVKVALAFIAFVSHSLSLFRPQSESSKEEQARTAKDKNTTLADKAIIVGIVSSRILVGSIFFAEVAVNMAQAYPSSAWSENIIHFLGGEKGAAIPIYTSPVFVAGVASTFLGSAIRLICFRELGKFFTYELAIRDKHKLVMSGPYSIVRHPSYTGIALVYVGITLCGLAKGTWMMESGIMHTAVGWTAATVWAVIVGYVTFVISRARQEDIMLRREFGEEWEMYAKRVPCRYVPGVL
ncbi:hypothetical protein BV25DRAFT_1828306 [Artomyces pyxidatus]|uniref:Uncharacterized protein n=1 Tax=Artomyces pyxidatus TaxID=48021 RepID=A0ACB8SUQ0_9AGAM|nr:hypothetical protein BV25DRAFT_1828306 [Artomyces pyxidatus]